VDIREALAFATRNARWIGYVWYSIGCAVLAASIYRQRHFFHDDVFIEMRYARNFIEFHQIAWNLGERVEGFTSPMHLLLVSLLGGLGIALPHAVHLLNFLALGLLLSGVAFTGRHVGPNNITTQAISFLVVAGSAPVAIWVWGGLEAVLAAAFVSWALAYIAIELAHDHAIPSIRHLMLAGLFYAFAVLTRPDCAVIAAVSAFGIFAVAPATSLAQRIVRACAVLAPVLATQAVLIGLRWIVYQDTAPNTYYAKVYGVPLIHRMDTGFQYLLRSAADIPLIPVVAVIIALSPRMVRDRLVAVSGLAVVAFLGAVWWVGGDHMDGARLLIPLLPVLAVLVIGVIRNTTHSPLARGLLLLGIALSIVRPFARPALSVDPAAWVGTLVGEYIDQHWHAQSLVALNTAGSTPYFAPQLKFIDMLGLNDRHIAHRTMDTVTGGALQRLPGHGKGDGAYVLGRRPDFIIAGVAEGQSIRQSPFIGDMQLAQIETFHQCYKEESVEIPYDDHYAAIGPRKPNPLTFTYYRRTCG
jgi:arabinofuranosyltransferase